MGVATVIAANMAFSMLQLDVDYGIIIITNKSMIHKEHARDKLNDRAATYQEARC